MKFAENFRKIRIRLGITQYQLASKMKVTQGAISHWERGLNVISEEMAQRLMKLAGKKGIYFSSNYLRGNNGNHKST